MRHGLLVAVATALSIAAAQAQHGAHAPYAGLQTRAIKALSERDVADLRAGRGMGLALAAELNGYPGPMHALELADRLGLSGEQRARLEALFEAMRAEAIGLGERLIEREAALDRAFRERAISHASLVALTDDIGAAQAALRRAHLRYHLSTMDVLTADQVRAYGALRGYHGGAH